MEWQATDASSSLSKYGADRSVLAQKIGCLCGACCLAAVSLITFLWFSSTAKKPKAQPGCILLAERLWSQGTEKHQVMTSPQRSFTNPRRHAHADEGLCASRRKGRPNADRTWENRRILCLCSKGNSFVLRCIHLDSARHTF